MLLILVVQETPLTPNGGVPVVIWQDQLPDNKFNVSTVQVYPLFRSERGSES